MGSETNSAQHCGSGYTVRRRRDPRWDCDVWTIEFCSIDRIGVPIQTVEGITACIASMHERGEFDDATRTRLLADVEQQRGAA